MRKFLLSLMVGATTIAMAQTQEVTLEMKPGYAKQVYYKFSDGSTHSYDKASWDLAFFREGYRSKGIRINGGNGLEVFEVSQDISKWNEIGISDQSNWKALYNSDKSWQMGAFDNGSAEYGWGKYGADHHLRGTVIFVIKKGEDYYKFMVPDLFYEYNIKYAKWNSTTNSWGADMTAQIPANNDKYFNFFSFDTNAPVEAQPDKYQWDILFTKYITDFTTNNGDVVKYNLTGVLQNIGVEVAEVEETTPTQNTATLTYSSDIDAIGYDWKDYKGGSFKMVENRVYYVKTITDRVYRLWFTEFGGYSKGTVKFNQTDTGELSTVDADGNVSFGVYPNPVTGNKISIVYDNKQDVASAAQVEIYNMAGQKVFATELSSSKGFYQREVNIGSLAKGVYILKFIYGGNVETKKLMVK